MVAGGVTTAPGVVGGVVVGVPGVVAPSLARGDGVDRSDRDGSTSTAGTRSRGAVASSYERYGGRSAEPGVSAPEYQSA